MNREKQIEEIYKPMCEELFNNIEKQYQEIAKIQEREKQIDIIEADIKTGMRDMEISNPRVYRGLTYRPAAIHLEAIGYRKQSEGEWIEHPHFNFEGSYSGANYECSNCHYDDCYEKEPYCPKCGASMKGGAE